MRKSIFLTLLMPLIGISLITFSVENVTPQEEKYELSRFISPDTCGGCHSSIKDQWQQSLHNISHKDPLYIAIRDYFLKGINNEDEKKEAESCVKCHTPIGYITGFPTMSSDDMNKVPEIAKYGIQCDYCHSAKEAERLYNNGLVMAPGNGENNPGAKRGPFKDSVSDYHDSLYSSFHTNSEICGTCHNVKHVVFGTDLETTYEEWKNGPYYSSDASKRIGCQECHMYQKPGVPATGSTIRPQNKGQAADDGPVREHIFTHYFVGANSFVPGLFGDQEKVKMAEERLKNAATLAIEPKNLAEGQFKITIKNIGAGHKLPTGLADARQMWLEIIVKNEHNKSIYSSGKIDEKGYLPKDTIIFNNVFGDGKGNPIINIASARQILKDDRIPPLASVDKILTLPKGGWQECSISVRLLYRLADQQLVDTILKEKSVKLPVVEMAKIENRFKLTK